MAITWILVANASQAHLYSSTRAKLFNGKASLSLVNQFMHPQSREKGSELVTDKLGHSGHGTFVEASEPKQQEADSFARELITLLEEGRVKQRFEDLMIIASPKFWGMLNKYLNGPLNHMLSVNIAKDYTKDNPNQLMKHLREHL